MATFETSLPRCYPGIMGNINERELRNRYIVIVEEMKLAFDILILSDRVDSN